MPRRFVQQLVLLVALVLGLASTATADITAFLGTSRVGRESAIVAKGESDTQFRMTKGVAVGFSLVIIGFEFEWASTSGGEFCQNREPLRAYCAPALMTGMGNVLLQTPHAISPVQVYGTAGAGLYRERYQVMSQSEPLQTDYGVGTNVGGGVKIDVAGPLRVRVDYRVFKLANGAFNSTPQRLYVGANLAF